LLGSTLACAHPSAAPTPELSSQPPELSSQPPELSPQPPRVEAPVASTAPEPEPEEIELPYDDSPIEADVDGDGEPERIAWDCADPATLQVGAAKLTRALGQSEIVGCTLAVVALAPGSRERFVYYRSDEHEEVGPPTHILYRYRDATLVELWSGTGDLTLYDDGSWATVESSCFETRWETEFTRNRWDGSGVVETVETESEPNEGGCDEP
jgi:hypothetical protein